MKRPLTKSAVSVLYAAGATWPGVDESVVERYASQAGHPATKPLIDTDQGDLLLFVFLLAGLVAGFIIGYYWRALFKGRIPESKMRQSEYRVQIPGAGIRNEEQGTHAETIVHMLQPGAEESESAGFDGGAGYEK
ncbi:MAG: hypothetical protein ACYC56_06060 [Candidatus Aquicultor sp.]